MQQDATKTQAVRLSPKRRGSPDFLLLPRPSELATLSSVPFCKLPKCLLLRFHSFSFPLFGLKVCFVLGSKSVDIIIAFLNDSVFGVSTKNNTFSDVSIFDHFKLKNKLEEDTFHPVFI